jgi:conjugation system TraG family ATPase
MQARQINMSDRLPFLDVEHECILGKNGDISQVISMHFPIQGTIDEATLEMIHQSLLRAAKILGTGWVIHQQTWVKQHTYSTARKSEGFLASASDQYFTGRQYFTSSSYLILTKKAFPAKMISSMDSNLICSFVPPQTIELHSLTEIKSRVEQFRAILKDAGVFTTLLSGEEILSSPSHAGLLERFAQLSSTDELLIKDVSFEKNITVGDQFVQVFSLADTASLPALCGPVIKDEVYSTERSALVKAFANPIYCGLACDHITNVVIELLDTKTVMDTLERRARRLTSLSSYSKENLSSRNAVNAYMQECVEAQRSCVRIGINVMTIATSAIEMTAHKKMISAAAAKMDAVAKIESVGAPQIFWACFPGNAGNYPTNDMTQSFAEQGLCFFNTESQASDDFQGPLVRFTERMTGRPIAVDLSDTPMQRGQITNRNMAIFGPSGSGKSFFTNHLLRSLFDADAHVLIIDIGHSYENLCTINKGYYFTYSENRPIAFNPFYLGTDTYPDTEKKESIITLLLALWKKDDEHFSRSEYVVLSNAIDGFYAWRGERFADFDLFYSYFKDVFLSKLPFTEFNANSFLYVLNPYCAGGAFSFLLNAKENLDLLEKRFIVFELDNIKDHPVLLPVITIIIMETFIAKMRKLKGVRKVMLIEEAWKAIARNGMAEYIKYLFKTVRKFYGQAIIVTQEIDDIIHSPIVKHSIINNADIKILLDQRKYQNRFEPVAELLGLSETEKAMALSLNRANDPKLKYKEVFISLGGQFSNVYRVEVSPAEYYCYTTEEKEKLKVSEYANMYGSIEKGIEELIKDKK